MTSNTNNHADDPYFSTLESVMRVSLAGFGGALAGLSFARRGRLAAAAVSAATPAASRARPSATTTTNSSSRIVSSASVGGSTTFSTNHIGKKRLQRQLTPIVRSIPPSTKPYVDRELPVAWALACMTFAGIVEGTRIISPTSVIWELMDGESKINDSSSNDCEDAMEKNKDEKTIPLLQFIHAKVLNSSMITISDYMMGGAIAGALFRGSAVRSSAGAKVDASILGSSAAKSSIASGRAMSGIFPGAGLGLLAGIAIVSMDHAQILVEETFGREEEEEDFEHEIEVEMEIPADIRAMSNEELMKSIEDLKKSMSDTPRQKEDVVDVPVGTDENDEVRDLISMLGFRSHRS